MYQHFSIYFFHGIIETFLKGLSTALKSHRLHQDGLGWRSFRRRHEHNDMNLHVLLGSARSRRWLWTGNALDASWLRRWEVSNRSWRSYEGLRSLQRQPRSAQKPEQFSKLLPPTPKTFSFTTVGCRVTVPCPYLSIEIRDWSQSCHFYYFL